LQGEPVVTYQTDGRIHPNASRILLDILKTRKSNYESLRLVKDIYEVVSNGNFVSWRATSAKPQMATETKDVLAEFRPAIPRLEKLLSDPASIDNNLTATWLADRQVIRLTASIQAELGYATVTVDTQSYGDEESQRTLFKLLAEPDKTLRASQVRRILKKSVQAVAIGVHEGGVDSVSERFSDEQGIILLQAHGSREEIDTMDQSIKNGSTKALVAESKILPSGARASLLIAKRAGCLTIMPLAGRPDVQYRLIFESRRLDQELSSSQVQYLRNMYRLMTSEDDKEQSQGIKLCAEARTKVERWPAIEPKEGELFVGSLNDPLSMFVQSRGYNLETLLGKKRAERVGKLSELFIQVQDEPSEWLLRSALQASVNIRVEAGNRNRYGLQHDPRPQDIRYLSIFIMNDDSLDVAVINGLSTSLRCRLRTGKEFGVDAAEAVATLIEDLADQPHSSWRLLLSKLLVPEEEIAKGYPFGLTDEWKNDFPPLADHVGLQMYEEAALAHRWLAAGVRPPDPCGVLKYVEPGCVELDYQPGIDLPGMRLVFSQGTLKEFHVTRLPLLAEARPGDAKLRAIFESKTLSIGSEAYNKCLDDLSVVLAKASVAGIHFSTRLVPQDIAQQIIDTVQKYMPRTW
jgi:hypothetical protein